VSKGRAGKISKRTPCGTQLEMFELEPAPAPAREPAAPLRGDLSRNEPGPTALERWAAKMARGRDVQVVYTENRVVLASLGGTDEAPCLRAHRIFRAASDGVAEALAKLYLGRPRRTTRRELQRRLREFIRVHEDAVPATKAPPRVRPPAGEARDLRPILERVNRTWFGGKLDVIIGWSPRPARRTLARWHEVSGDRSRIVVNSLLDAAVVPERVLDYLVYHEALHETLRDRMEGGRRVYHHAEFRRRERLFPDLDGVGAEAERVAERLWRSYRRRRKR
jgi:hypothetical protein